jgi:hypothetical protein
MNIIVRNYEHYNRAMGKYITSKAHYEREMQAGGYVPFEKAEQMAEKARSEQTKKYDGLSPEKMRFLNQVKGLAGKKGNIEVTDRFVKGLKEQGVINERDYKLPKCYQQGGFD